MDRFDDAPDDFKVEFSPLKIVAISARSFWAPTMFKKLLGFISTDDRPGAPKDNVFWAGNRGEAGQELHGHESAWRSAGFLHDDPRQSLSPAPVAAGRQWREC